jgi:hypothetical protein
MDQQIELIRVKLATLDDERLRADMGSLLARLSEEELQLNDLSVQTRAVCEGWLTRRIESKGLKKLDSLKAKVDGVRPYTGSPSRQILYLEALRELGNVGAHASVAPQPLAPEDLITLTIGLRTMVELHPEMS